MSVVADMYKAMYLLLYIYNAIIYGDACQCVYTEVDLCKVAL